MLNKIIIGINDAFKEMIKLIPNNNTEYDNIWQGPYEGDIQFLEKVPKEPGIYIFEIKIHPNFNMSDFTKY